MMRMSKVFIFGFVLALIGVPRLHAQTEASAPADTDAGRERRGRLAGCRHAFRLAFVLLVVVESNQAT